MFFFSENLCKKHIQIGKYKVGKLLDIYKPFCNCNVAKNTEIVTIKIYNTVVTETS